MYAGPLSKSSEAGQTPGEDCQADTCGRPKNRREDPQRKMERIQIELTPPKSRSGTFPRARLE
jgi:hypothetical protein